MILMIDNYDSFTYNLVQYLEEIGAGAGGAQRCDGRGSRSKHCTRGHRHLPRAGRPAGCRHLLAAIERLFRPPAHPGRLPGPPVPSPRPSAAASSAPND
jgi:hypothetical protein